MLTAAGRADPYHGRMRAVVQRVSRAEVRVDGATVGSIGPGLAALVGVTEEDSEADAVAVADRMSGLRIFPDEAGAMNRSVEDVDGRILVVSQFTLYADARRGRRPSFVGAARREVAEPLVLAVVERIEAAGIPVETGSFGDMMEVELVNDGPVTILLETRDGRLV